MLFCFPFPPLTPIPLSRELTSQGKIPHDVELEKHPEKSMEGRMWLMGDVSALIKVGRGPVKLPAPSLMHLG